MEQQQEFKGMLEILDVAEISPNTPEAILVVFAVYNLEFIVSIEKRPENPDEATQSLKPPVFFLEEADARIYFDFLVCQLSEPYQRAD